jgi:hypothetical protein
MALNWKSVSAEHVREALLIVSAKRATDLAAGIVILDRGRRLPAKEVLRTAYQLANQLPRDAKIKFSSGDGTLNVLRNLGFEAERIEKE